MKKLTITLLLALFIVGFSSCAVDSSETDPVIPEVQIEDPGTDSEEEEDNKGNAWYCLSLECQIIQSMSD